MNTICVFSEYKKGISCPICGFTLKRNYPYGYMRVCEPYVTPITKSIGIGTRLGRLLKSLGFQKTEECGCYKKEQKLNIIGWWFMGFFSKKYRTLSKSTKAQRIRAASKIPYTPSPEKLARQQALLNAQTAQSS